MTAAFLSSSKNAKETRFARLSLEKLEQRDCPAQIAMFTAAVPYQHHVEISGMVTDCPVGGVQIQISGAVSATTWTNPDGTFSLSTDEASLGTVYAVGLDQGLEITDVADTTIASNAPVVSFEYINNAYGDFWTIRGHVSDESAQGLTVHIGGLQGYQNPLPPPPPPPGGGLIEVTDAVATSAEGYTAIVDADGNFELVVYLEPAVTQNAIATAQVTDWWQLQSNLAMCSLM